MADIVFYEKPGCINNRKQKKLLQEAGHQVEVRNLLTWHWTPDSLHLFLRERTPDLWINRTHPGLKSGELSVDLTQPDQLLEQMCADPLLIRRPLMEIDGRFYQGFDAERIDREIGLKRLPEGDIETCPNEGTGRSCASEES